MVYSLSITGRKHRNYRYYYKNAERLREAERKVYLGTKDKVFSLLGNKCSRCRFEDKRALQLDHVKCDAFLEYKHGRHERKMGPRAYYSLVLKSILNNEGRYQILCANCNWIKRYENKEHRKRIEIDNQICKPSQKQATLFPL